MRPRSKRSSLAASTPRRVSSIGSIVPASARSWAGMRFRSRISRGSLGLRGRARQAGLRRPSGIVRAVRTLHLVKGRDAATRRRHPWLFSGAVARQEGASPDGSVEARDASGAFLARGFASPAASIVARFWTFEDRPLDAGFVAARVREAVALRDLVVPPETDGYRVVNAEGDFLPGLVVDRYGGALVVQATTEGTERARPLWLPPLLAAFPGATVVQKNDLPSRRGEGLPLDDELLAGDAQPAAGGVPRAGPRFRRGDLRRPEDGLLPRPAREPRSRPVPRGGPQRPRPVLLLGRVRRRRARRRRDARRPRRRVR